MHERNFGANYMGIQSEMSEGPNQSEEIAEIGHQMQEAGILVELAEGHLYHLNQYRYILKRHLQIGGIADLEELPLPIEVLSRYIRMKEANPTAAIHYRPVAEFDGRITLSPVVVIRNPMNGKKMQKFLPVI